MNELTIKTDTNCQISPLMMDAMPVLKMRQSWLTEHKIKYELLPWIKLMDLIIDLGDLEHTNDWDPSISINFHDGTKLETECGYYNMHIQDDKLLLEDEKGAGQETNGDYSYHLIPIDNILSMELIRN